MFSPDEEEIAFCAAEGFIAGMSTRLLRNYFLEVIQDILCDYRDHILNSTSLDEEGSIVEEVAFSRNLLEGDSDSYLYATKIIDELTDLCIDLEDICDASLELEDIQ